MTLYLVGLGLDGEDSISVRGFNIVKRADRVFLENYTSRLADFNLDRMNSFFGKKLELVNRSFVEDTRNLITLAANEDVVLLVVGDPMVATTHLELKIAAREAGVDFVIVNNASIINAVANLGVHVYKLGKITSIPFTTESFVPESPYNVIKENKSIGAHTLCLLDLKPNENRFMSFNEAIDYLLSLEEKHGENIINGDTLVVGCGALGSKRQEVVFGRIRDVEDRALSVFPQSLIVLSELHFTEESALKEFYLEK